MTVVITRVEAKFPAAAFAALRREVFAALELESPALAAVLAAERRDGIPEPDQSLAFAPVVRFGASVGDTLIGWSLGYFERGNGYYMASSGVAPAQRRRGVYSALLEASIGHARASGASVVRSQHSVLNNAVIIAKLKRGFHVSGLNVSASMGNLVELSLNLSDARQALYRSRVIPLIEPYGA